MSEPLYSYHSGISFLSVGPIADPTDKPNPEFATFSTRVLIIRSLMYNINVNWKKLRRTQIESCFIFLWIMATLGTIMPLHWYISIHVKARVSGVLGNSAFRGMSWHIYFSEISKKASACFVSELTLLFWLWEKQRKVYFFICTWHRKS